MTPKYLANARARFIAKCKFNACTGCVEWTGGRTRGQGHTAWYGAFWFDGRSVLAHRFAAEYIHGHRLEPWLQVDHECRNTLCVQHLQSISAELNRELQWVRVQVGLLPDPQPYVEEPDLIPFFIEPNWIKHERSSNAAAHPTGIGARRRSGISEQRGRVRRREGSDDPLRARKRQQATQ